jgi:Tol biopolymer transport system component
LIITGAAWSPDGQLVAVASGTGDKFDLAVYDADTEQLVALNTELLHEASARLIGWSADGMNLAFYKSQSGRTTQTIIWNPFDGSEERLVAASASWAHTGKRLAYLRPITDDRGLQSAAELRVHDFASGADELLITVLGRGASEPSWSADDASLAVTAFEPDGTASTLVIDVHQRAIRFSLAGSWLGNWSPVGNTLVVVGNVCGAFDIFTVGSDGHGSRNHTNSPDAIDWMPRWSPDGHLVAFSTLRPNSSLGILSLPYGTVTYPVVVAAGEPMDILDFSPDSRYAAFSYGGGRDLCTVGGPQSTLVRRPGEPEGLPLTGTAGSRQAAGRWLPTAVFLALLAAAALFLHKGLRSIAR